MVKTLHLRNLQLHSLAIMASQQSSLLLDFDSTQFETFDTQSDAPTQSSLALTSRKRPRTLKIQDHTPEHRDTVYVNRYGKAVWRCKYCRKEYQETSGTAVVTTHLLDAHAIAITSIQAMKTLSQQSNISEAFQRG